MLNTHVKYMEIHVKYIEHDARWYNKGFEGQK